MNIGVYLQYMRSFQKGEYDRRMVFCNTGDKTSEEGHSFNQQPFKDDYRLIDFT